MLQSRYGCANACLRHFVIRRVPAPSPEQALEVLHSVAKKESLVLPPAFAGRLVEKSGRNLRRALLFLEVARVQQYPFSDEQPVQVRGRSRLLL